MIMEIGVQYSGISRALPLAALAEMRDTISTLIPVELAGFFGDGRCCHPSGYLQIDGIRLCLGISRFRRRRLDCSLSGKASRKRFLFTDSTFQSSVAAAYWRDDADLYRRSFLP
jgi:hypothetical protein